MVYRGNPSSRWDTVLEDHTGCWKLRVQKHKNVHRKEKMSLSSSSNGRINVNNISVDLFFVFVAQGAGGLIGWGIVYSLSSLSDN